MLPTVVVGSAFLALLGPRSPINAVAEVLFGADVPQVRLDGSVGAILVAHVFYNIAVVIRLVGGMWAHIDPRTEEAARMLGASPWRAFREVTWPLLRPAVISAASIVFLFTVTSFGVVLLLGGPRDTTLEVEIYRQTAVLLDLPTAAALTHPADGRRVRAAARQRARPGGPGRATAAAGLGGDGDAGRGPAASALVVAVILARHRGLHGHAAAHPAWSVRWPAPDGYGLAAYAGAAGARIRACA